MKLLKLAFIVFVLLGMRWAFAYDFTTTYSYSTVSRLTGAVYGTGNSINYCYDLNGNRLELNNGSATNGIGLMTATARIIENRNSLVIPVIRTGNPSAVASVSYSTENGSATDGSDYTATSGTLTWAPNNGCAKFITIPLNADSIQEADESFTVRLSNPVGAPLSSAATLTVTLVNDDIAGSLAFSPSTASVSEAAGSVSFNVIRTGGSDGVVSVNYATANSTASSGVDYTATRGTLTWAAGDMAAKNIVVPITEDTLVEADEIFTVTLSNPTGGVTLGSTITARATILNNDCSSPVAQPIGLNVQLSGSLQATDGCGVRGFDYFTDEYTFTGSAGQVVSISYGSEVFDNFLYLLDSAGTILKSDDDGGGNSDSLITNYTLPSNGIYRIQATSYGLRTTGAYLVQLTSNASKLNQTIGPITFTPATLAVGGTTMASATATSNLAVTFSTASSACTATGVNGKTITGVAAGACLVTARQAGNASYNAAAPSAKSITVGTVTTPAISLSSTALVFGARSIGTISPSQQVTLTNTGGAMLNIASIVTSGDFAHTNYCGATLAAGASCSIYVTFTPTVMGVRTGAVTITSNAVGSPHRITLTGTDTRYDFDGNGKADIMWRNTTSGDGQIWFMNGGIKVGSVTTTTAAANWTIASVDDFNGDGKADIMWRDTVGETGIWLMNGSTPLSSTIISPVMIAPWAVAETGDFDGNGKADILWHNAATGQNEIWFMNGTSKSSYSITTAATALAVAGVNDFNGDGKADILWRNAATGQNEIWFMNNTTKAGGGLIAGTIVSPWTIAGTGDFDGDGKADILWRNTTSGENTVWFMNGTAATVTTTVAATTDWSVAGVADFNGDGKVDISWRNPTTGATALWLMNGAVRNASVPLAPAMLPPWSVAK